LQTFNIYGEGVKLLAFSEDVQLGDEIAFSCSVKNVLRLRFKMELIAKEESNLKFINPAVIGFFEPYIW